VKGLTGDSAVLQYPGQGAVQLNILLRYRRFFQFWAAKLLS
jgi:hypothetical protein